MFNITDKFRELDAQKRQRILDAAYKEFAEHGYAHASTNHIVKQAGIGKGMLFYYFSSKEQLFDFLCDCGITYLIERYLERIDDSVIDFVDRYRHAGAAKMEAMAENPHLFGFFTRIYLNGDHVRLSPATRERLDEMFASGRRKLYGNIDTSAFRKDVDGERLLKYAQWILTGYENELSSALRGQVLTEQAARRYWSEFDIFMHDMKALFYK